MKYDKALRRDSKRDKAKARRALRVHSRAIVPLQSEVMVKAALAFKKEAR